MNSFFQQFPTLLSLSGTHEVFGLSGITDTDRKSFVDNYYPAAKRVGKKFGINPVVIMAQAAMESGWGTSYMARNIFNFFGVTAYGQKNDYWKGDEYVSKTSGLKFRKYASADDGFSDFARLISSKYKDASAASFTVTDYAHNIAYSPYISEKNGDNRESYRKGIISNAAYILKASGATKEADYLTAEAKKISPAKTNVTVPAKSTTSTQSTEPKAENSAVPFLIAGGAAAAALLFFFNR